MLRWLEFDYERMLSRNNHAMQTQPQTTAVARSQAVSSNISSRWRWALYAAAGIAIVLAVKYFDVQDLLKEALDWIGKLGPWGPAIFVGLYVLATVFFVPGSVLTLGAGAVFGEPAVVVIRGRCAGRGDRSFRPGRFRFRHIVADRACGRVASRALLIDLPVFLHGRASDI